MKSKKTKTTAKENIEYSAKYKKQLRQVETALKKSGTKLPFDLKMKTVELILKLMQHRKNFGMFVILGWKNRWQRYADTPDASQDIFAIHRINILKSRPAEQRKTNITKTVNFDGAILIDRRGDIVHSGAMIEGLRPRATAHKLNPYTKGDLSLQFGFKKKCICDTSRPLPVRIFSKTPLFSPFPKKRTVFTFLKTEESFTQL